MPPAAMPVKMLMVNGLAMVLTLKPLLLDGTGSITAALIVMTGMVNLVMLLLVFEASALPRVPMTHPTARRMPAR